MTLPSAIVAENSNSALPVWYRVAATWGAHEGSLLLWVLLLSVWTFAVAIFSRRMPLDAVARVLAVMGMIAFGFLLFILFTSNPRSAAACREYPIDGRDLNPLLRDIGMIFHPPILYIRVMSASRWPSPSPSPSLLAGRLDTAWALVASLDPGGMDVPHPRHRAGLGVGILRTGLGRLVVLGPGGKRLVYAVAGGNRAAALPGGNRKRGSFRAWTVLLAIAAFSLCLLGTFLVRSGGAGFGACLRLGSVARAVYSGTADCRHRRIAAAVRPEGRPGAGAGGTYAVVARVVPAWQQYLADGRDAGGAPRDAAAAGA